MAKLHKQSPIALIVTGGAPGADRLARLWAQHQKIPVCEFPPNWQFEGKAAGPRRNEAMLRFARPSLVVAFPGGPGTQDMKRQAEVWGVSVWEPATPQPVDVASPHPPLLAGNAEGSA